MARRINTKFAIILVVCICGAGAATGATWYVVMRASAAADVREANAAMEAGDYLEATVLYAKALRHRKNAGRIDLILKSADAHRNVVVTTQRDAATHLRTRLSRMRLAIRLNPHYGSALQDYMDLSMRVNQEVQIQNGWDFIANF